MPNYRRRRIPGASVFFTVCLADRGSSLLLEEVDILRQAVRVTRERRPFRIDAFVVLPNHLHAVWTLPDQDHDYSQRWGGIKAYFSKHVRRSGRAPDVPVRTVSGGVNPALRRGHTGIWQQRFWEHHIRNRKNHQAHVRLCLTDPVKHGLASRPEDWLHSSIHRDIRNGTWTT